ncbi:GNAT family N-acetyltransferase [Eubacteriales bacterium OttesenSCG-928-G02]|nr:GNAT family N-acetyltransferase [Eubacteriales bacterium OttesenSCG-928-G02]
MNIKYKQLEVNDLSPDIFNNFNRYQEVKKCWRKKDNSWILIDHPFIEDWSIEQKKQLATVYLPGTIKNGGIVAGAFDGENLIGFFALAGDLIGSRKQYIRLISLHVSNEYRNKGIGKNLFNLCANAAKATKAEKLYISTHSSQESHAFYRAMNCIHAEEIIPELYKKEPFDVHMEYILI